MLVHGLPPTPESAIVRATGGEVAQWSVTDYLIADVVQSLTGEVHPARPRPPKALKRGRSKTAALLAQKQRLEAPRPA